MPHLSSHGGERAAEPATSRRGKQVKTATAIRDMKWGGNATLYQLSHDVEYDRPHDKNDLPAQRTRFVIVSAVCAMITGDETLIFPANEQGEALSWTELDGSYRGGQDHNAALARAGFECRPAP